ncbi:hypothetical protein BCR34DRAFT_206911 [Clohesyomyces aquaticus]|uniref:F-box domain-containing protein n=1 Tax=Clohesyomyces aquaticus TaxID=1231657 RepID=A0A1Y2A9I0_9PLEO|nr:hypothetical protein BCR34DRAFT_206911 [Clohesyomyces aquaticus]
MSSSSSTRRKRKGAPTSPVPSTRPPKRASTRPRPPPGRHRPNQGPPSDAMSPDDSAFLDRLPDELLLQVLELLDVGADERNTTFYSLCLISRRFGRLGQHVLYKTFDLDCGRPGPFLRTVIARPDLAQRVRYVLWEYNMAQPGAPPADQPSSSDLRSLRASLKRQDLPWSGQWQTMYASGHAACLLKLLLLHTPNIRYLGVVDRTSPRAYFDVSLSNESWTQLFFPPEHRVPSSPGLSSRYTQLHTLHLRMGGIRMEHIHAIIRLPSLRRLILNGAYHPVNGPSQDNGVATCVPSSSNIVHLEVHRSFMSHTGLAQLVKACRKLEHLVFSYDSQSYTRNVAEIGYPILAAALHQHKHTLEHIDLDDLSDRKIPALIDYPRGTIGSFQDFTKLNYLGCPIEAFQSWNSNEWGESHVELHNVLPKTLEHFSLTVFESEEVDGTCYSSLASLSAFPGRYSKGLPQLRNITIRVHPEVYLKNTDLWKLDISFVNCEVYLRIIQDGKLWTRDDFFEDSSSDGEEDSDIDSETLSMIEGAVTASAAAVMATMLAVTQSLHHLL